MELASLAGGSDGLHTYALCQLLLEYCSLCFICIKGVPFGGGYIGRVTTKKGIYISTGYEPRLHVEWTVSSCRRSPPERGNDESTAHGRRTGIGYLICSSCSNPLEMGTALLGGIQVIKDCRIIDDDRPEAAGAGPRRVSPHPVRHTAVNASSAAASHYVRRQILI